MYRIYTTEGFVVASRPYGEASATLVLFTEELGLVRVRAQGVREVRSKLRYGVQQLSLSTFSLVRGREVWRLTSVSPCVQASTDHYTTDFRRQRGLTPFSSFAARALFARVLGLVQRLVHGEEQDRKLFFLLRDTFLFLHEEQLTAVELRQLELLTVLRVLHHLGYVGSAGDGFAIQPEDKLTRFMLANISGKEAFLLQTVNASLKATQL